MRLFQSALRQPTKARRATKSSGVAHKRSKSRTCRFESLENRTLLTVTLDWAGLGLTPDWTDKNNWRKSDDGTPQPPTPTSSIRFTDRTTNDHPSNVGGTVSTLTIQKPPVPANTSVNSVQFDQTNLLTVSNTLTVNGGNFSTNGSATVGGSTRIGNSLENDDSVVTFPNNTTFTTGGDVQLGIEGQRFNPPGAAFVRLNAATWSTTASIFIGVATPGAKSQVGESRLFVDAQSSLQQTSSIATYIQNGGYLEGSGTILGDVNDNAGTISPGNRRPQQM